MCNFILEPRVHLLTSTLATSTIFKAFYKIIVELFLTVYNVHKYQQTAELSSDREDKQ